MGYRVSREQFIRLKHIEKEFGLSAALELVRTGFDYDQWAVLVPNDERTDFDIRLMRWEFIPNHIPNAAALDMIHRGIDPKTGNRIRPIPWLNARSENLFVNDTGRPAMWANAARKRRCLVVATHFFEWRHYKPEGARREQTYPYYIEFFHHDEQLYMAGIWNEWVDKDTGEKIDGFAIVTTDANQVMAQIHNVKKRQPTILTQDLAWLWLMEDLDDDQISEIATYQLPSEDFIFHTVAKDFRETGDISPFNYPDLPPIDVAI